MDYKLYTLNNNFRIVYVPIAGIKSVYVELIGKIGSNYEKNNQIGCAHFLEHMVFSGTEAYPVKESLHNLILDIGGKFNGHTSKDSMSFEVKVLKEDRAKAFEFLTQILLHPSIEEEDIEKEKKVIEQELYSSLDNVNKQLHREAFKLIFPEQKISTPVLGELEDIQNMSKENLLDFKNSNFYSENFYMAISGDLKEKEILELANKYFGDMIKGKQNHIIQMQINPKLEIKTKSMERLNQSKILISFYGFLYEDEKKHKAAILSDALNRYFLKSLRHKKSYTYHISGRNISTPSYGTFDIQTSCSEESINKLLKDIKLELKKIMENPITQEQHETLIKTIKAHFIYSLEAPHSFAPTYAYQLMYRGQIINHMDRLRMYEQITRQDLQQVALELFSQDPKITIMSKDLKEEDISW